MVTRRLLLALIGLLSVGVLVGGLIVGALALRLLRPSTTTADVLVLGGDRQVLLVQANGTSRVVARDASADLFRYPTLAPDGQRMAYISQDADGLALFSVGLRSGERIELYRSRDNPPLYAAWSPDGQYVSFLTNVRSGGLAVHVVPADGSRQAELLGFSPRSSYFAWQPDGSTILLHIGGSVFEDGRVLRYRPGSATPLIERADPGFFQTPAWSVDGSQFYYVAQPAVDGPVSPEVVESLLTRVDADGGNPQVLVREQQAAMLFLRAPQSEDIAYVTADAQGFGALKIVRADGSQATLSAPEQRVPAFFWAPDGERIAYLTATQASATTPPQFTWHVVEVADGNTQEVASFTPSRAFGALVGFFDAYALSFSLWSPDSRQLIYGTDDGVYVVDVTNREIERRADGVLGMWVLAE
jgi:TolB protein